MKTIAEEFEVIEDEAKRLEILEKELSGENRKGVLGSALKSGMMDEETASRLLVDKDAFNEWFNKV